LTKSITASLISRAFAILANETISGNPNNVPSATGANEPVIMGKIIPGKYQIRSQ